MEIVNLHVRIVFYSFTWWIFFSVFLLVACVLWCVCVRRSLCVQVNKPRAKALFMEQINRREKKNKCEIQLKIHLPTQTHQSQNV